MGILKNLKTKITENQIAIFLVFAGVMLRVLPVLATGKLGNNIAPVAAIALFAGTYLKKKYAIWLPLIVMAISDVFIGFHNLMFLTWGSFALIGIIGLWLRENKNLVNTAVGTLTGSLLFFFVTNFGVWAFTPMYDKTWQGLVQCYAMAVPFFRNTLIGDALFVAVLFGVFELVRQLVVKENFVKEVI